MGMIASGGRNFLDPLLAGLTGFIRFRRRSTVKAHGVSELDKRSVKISPPATIVPGWVWGVCILGFMLFSFPPAVYELSRAGDLRPERQFELVHNFPTDYNFYLSRIRQGLEGRWTVVEQYTAEPHAGSLIHEAYLLMGRVGRALRVPVHRPADVYHVARIVFGVALLALIAAFCRRGFPARRSVLAFLLAVTASSWPKLVAVVDTGIVPVTPENILYWRFGGYMAWWSVMDSLQRITFIPHLLIGQAGIVVLILLVTSASFLKKPAAVTAIGIAAFVLGMVFPPGLVFVYAFMSIWLLFNRRTLRHWLVPFGAIFMISVPSLLYLFLMTGFYPWKRLAEVDIIRPIRFDYIEYFKAVGPVLPLGIIGMGFAIVAGEAVMLPAVGWVLAWLALLFGFALVPQQNPLRFSEMIPHVPLAVLTVYMCHFFAERARSRQNFLDPLLARLSMGVFHRHASVVKGPIVSELGKRFAKFSPLTAVLAFLPILLVSTGLFHMYSSYLWQKDFVDHKIRATLPLVPTGSFVMYPLKDFVGAIRVLGETTPKTAVILSETTAGNYIPVISGQTVYAGHDNTVDYEGKRERVKAFFAGTMDPAEARTWISVTGADYVFFGPQEKEDGGLTDLSAVYPFLEETYRNTNVTLYRIPQ